LKNIEGKTPVGITIESIQKTGGECLENRFEYTGVMYSKPDAVYLVYDDNGDKCSLKVQDDRVLMNRHNGASRLELESNAQCLSSYQTSCGTLEVVTRTSRIDNKISRQNLLELHYELEMGQVLSENIIKIKIKEI